MLIQIFVGQMLLYQMFSFGVQASPQTNLGLTQINFSSKLTKYYAYVMWEITKNGVANNGI